MNPPFLALAAPSAASLPGLALVWFVVTGRKMSSFEQGWRAFSSVAQYFLPFYILGAFVYGFVLWHVLRWLGFLSLPGFLIGSVVPVVIALAVDASSRGLAPGTQWVFLIFAFPCLLMGATLWLFTIGPWGTHAA
jgi:hypothetical protein